MSRQGMIAGCHGPTCSREDQATSNPIDRFSITGWLPTAAATLLVVVSLLVGCSEPNDTATKAVKPVDSGTQAPSQAPSQTLPANETAESSNEQATDSMTADSQIADGAKAKTSPIPPVAAAAPIDAALASEISHWLVQLADGADIERRAAIESLTRMDRRAVAYIVKRLKEGPPNERRGAAKFMIGRVGPRDTTAVDTLIELLNNGDATLRHTAFQAIERLPADQLQHAPSSLLPSLIRMLENDQEDKAYRVRIVRAIGSLGPAGIESAAVLMRLGREDPDLNIRRAAFAAIPKVVAPEDAELFFLEITGSDAPTDLRRLAVTRLGRVARTDQALDNLLQQFNDSDKVIRKAASDALVDIGRPAVPVLLQGLASENAPVRQYAAFTLGKLGPLAAEAIPALENQQNDPNEDVRKLVAAALRLIRRR